MKYLFLMLLGTSVTAQFTSNFYKILATDTLDKNLATSPISIEILMRMVYMGAGGSTAQELRKVLKLPADKKEVAEKYKKLLTNLEGRKRLAILDLANRIYVSDEYQLNSEYNKLVKDSFKAEAKTINFKSLGNAVSIVNKWVNDQTSGRIRDIVSPKDLGADLKVALLSGINFKAQWQYKFDPKKTFIADFHVTAKKRVPVEMMTLIGYFEVKLSFRLDAHMIELPFRDSSLSMFIFLPFKVDGLKKLVPKIGTYFYSRPEKEKVVLKLPKFKIEYSADLSRVLEKMGMRDTFGGSADLSGLLNSSKVPINKVFQKAFIELDEKGAEEPTVPVDRPCRQCEWDFNAEHPFAYVIRDREQNTTYLQGHFVNPEK
uniref:Heterochromatin-associated protein MENT-like n=1 Tax=Drosophila rhopaloa TaxID=1041015 RepID=A0A6P4FP78_DRORH